MPDPDWDTGVLREQTIRLHEVVPDVGDGLTYTYDFGAGWRHTLVVEDLLPPQRIASCMGGRRACPSEDFGGPWGYEQLLTVISDPMHPEHAERLEWLGGPIDPEAFDLTAAEAAVRTLS